MTNMYISPLEGGEQPEEREQSGGADLLKALLWTGTSLLVGGVGHEIGRNTGFQEGSQYQHPISWEAALRSRDAEVAEERRKTKAAENRARNESKAANDAYKLVVQYEALLAENGIEIPG